MWVSRWHNSRWNHQKDYISAACHPAPSTHQFTQCLVLRGKPRNLFTKADSVFWGYTNKQPSQNKRKNSLLPTPLLFVKPGLCSITDLSWGLQKLCKNSLMTVILSSTKEKWTPTHCTVRSFLIRRGGNNEGWAEIHAGMQSSARLCPFPGETDSGPRGAFASVPPQQTKVSILCTSLSFSRPDTHEGRCPLTSTTIVVIHTSPLLAEWEQMNE